MKLTTLICAAFLALLPVIAGATPSALIWIPSTDIQPSGTTHLTVNGFIDGNSHYDFGLTYGFADGRMEFGVDYLGSPYNSGTFNFKYLLAPETAQGPAVAVGVWNMGTRADLTNWNQFYLVMSKHVGPVRLTAGYSSGDESALGADDEQFMFGLDGYFDPDHRWYGTVDYMSGKNIWGALSAGVGYALDDRTRVLAGYNWYNSEAFDDTFTLQVDMDF